MKVKSVIQKTIIVLLIILAFSFIYTLNKHKIKFLNNKILETSNIKLTKIDLKKSDQILNLNYQSRNINGDVFEISARSGKIDNNNNSIILMNNVEANITINQGENIKINSHTAAYNLDDYSSIFRENVIAIYQDYQLNSKMLQLDFVNNKVIFFDNILHSFSNNGKIEAAVIKFDTIKKKFEFVSNENTKVVVTNNTNNGNN